jgi:hypothetical protein
MTKTNLDIRSPLPFTAETLPHFIELTADGTGVGKSLLATRLRDHYEDAGHPTTLVRIESRGIPRALRDGDVFIASEDFAQAEKLTGGIAAVLKPLYAALERALSPKSAVFVDWGGGLSQHRLVAYAATRFDERLAELGIAGLSLAVTTNASDRMLQTANALQKLALVAPRLNRGLVLNRRLGAFSFVAGTEQHRVFAQLTEASKGLVQLNIAAIGGESWKSCENAALSMQEVIMMHPADLGARIKEDPFTAAACASEIAAWWESTASELTHVARFRRAAAGE